MGRLRVLFVLALAGCVSAQLNFEGNPLTEYTEYTAEESNKFERNAGKKSIDVEKPINSTKSPQKLYPVEGKVMEQQQRQQDVNESTTVLNRVDGARSSFQGRQFNKNYPQMTPEQANYVAQMRLQQQRLDQQRFNQQQEKIQRIVWEDRKHKQHAMEQQRLQQVEKERLQQIEQQRLQQLEQQRLQQMEAQRLQQQEQEKLKKQQQLQWEQQQLQLAIELEQQKLKQQQQALIEQQQLASEAENKKKTEMAQVALNSFMNSKTPEESKLALDYYLSNSRDNGHKAPEEQTQQAALVVFPQDQFAYANEQSSVRQTIDDQQVQQVDNSQDTIGTYNVQESDYQSQVPDQYYQYTNYLPRAPTRNDLPVPPRMMYPKRPNRRYRNFPVGPVGPAQPRLGPPPSIFRGPHPPMIPGKPPIEVIYTKPPGVSGHPHPPLAAAGSWPAPPDSAYQPSKDIYWSQLYQQSYDPHYYNYIAKTGKIRPHLYGKLNGEEADSSSFDNSIWSDLYTGFKKHGLKNMMTPGFLLGMTIPALTLVLSALVQKRSLARSSDARAITSEDVIQEYLRRLQRANECYEKKRTSRSTDKVDGCE